MPLLLRIKDPQFFRKRSTGAPLRTIDLDREACPTIMATGIRSVGCDKYWLDDDGAPPVTDPKKPPFRVPSMAEIAAIPPNGLKVISTFAGCGGSSLGYRMAGFKVLWASEFVDAARAVYEANAAPGTIVDGRDIREVDPLAVLRLLKLKPGDLDVLDGSPPCASFSTAGKREKHWGETKKYSDKSQRTDDLFFEYVRFLKAMQPKVFVAENVSGLVKGTAKGYFLEILRAMKACGYRVEASLLDAQWLGVPQTRQRIIFQGVRKDLDAEPTFPTPLPYRYSVRDALPWIAGASFSTGGQNQARDPNLPPDAPAHSITAGAKNATHHQVEIVYRGQPGGKEWQERRRSIDEPSATVSKDGYGGAARHQTIVEVTHGNYSTSRKKRGQGMNLDAPLPTVVAGTHGGGPSQFEVRILPGDRGNRRRREEGKPHSLDAPLTAVLADGGRNTNRAQFMVEGRVSVVGNSNAAHSRKGERRSVDEPSRAVMARRVNLEVEAETDISKQAIGREYDKLNPGEQSDKYFSLVRADAGAPSPTVTAAGGMNSGIACVTHPTEKRKFAIAELKRICAFPDDFELSGSYAQQWERLGRAVPPVMMKAIAETIRDRVFERSPRARASGGRAAPAGRTVSSSGRRGGSGRA